MTDYYVRSGGGNSNGGSTTYSLTSGGPADGANPTASDNVFLDANSGQLTVNATFACANFDCTGYTNTLSGSSGMTITGSTFKLVAGMTTTNTSALTFTGANAAGDVTLTRAGKTTNQGYTFNGSGKVFKLADAHNLGTSSLSHTNGTLNSQTFDITCGLFNSNNTNTRTLTLTGSDVTASRVNIDGTNLTLANPDAFYIASNSNTEATILLANGGVTISSVIIDFAAVGSSNAYGGLITFGGGSVVTQLSTTGTPSSTLASCVLTLSANATINSGTIGAGVQLCSNAPGTRRTITSSGGLLFDGCMIRDIAITTASYATNSIDLGNNSGITFNNFGPNTHEIVGVTEDADGAVLPSQVVIAFKEDGGVMKEVSRVTSDAVTAEYTLGTPDNDPEYLIVSYSAATQRADAMNEIEPTVP